MSQAAEELRHLQDIVRQLRYEVVAQKQLLSQLKQDLGQIAGASGFGGSGGRVSPAVATSVITGEAAGTVGSGTAVLRIMAGGTLSDGEEVTVYNNFTADTPDTTKIMVGEDELGRWWLLSEDCA